jgi:hypothetical protein
MKSEIRFRVYGSVKHISASIFMFEHVRVALVDKSIYCASSTSNQARKMSSCISQVYTDSVYINLEFSDPLMVSNIPLYSDDLVSSNSLMVSNIPLYSDDLVFSNPIPFEFYPCIRALENISCIQICSCTRTLVKYMNPRSILGPLSCTRTPSCIRTTSFEPICLCLNLN